MIMRFDRALRHQEIYANGRELAAIMGMDRDADGNRVHSHPDAAQRFVTTIDDPVLCTDFYRIARLGEQDPVLRDTVMALYGGHQRVTVYDDTEVWFVQDRYPGVWGPSIDTLFFCRGLGAMELDDVRTSAEIGSGSGFISKWLLEHHPGLEKAAMVDFHDLAIEASRAAIEDSRTEFHVGDGLEYLADKRFDLVMCNPPYIPRPRSIDDNPYEGVGLFVQLIERMADYVTLRGRLVLNLSSLADDIALEAARRVGARVSHLDSMTVPLKVYNVLNNAEWRDYLVREKGLVAENRDGYDFWHTLRLIEFRP